MREDNLTARKVLERIAHKQTQSGTASFMGIVKYRLCKGGVDKVSVDRVGRVDEDDGIPFA